MTRIVGFVPYSSVDWPGKLCATIFLPGCNFRCGYCYNVDIVNDTEKMDIPLSHILRILKEYGKPWYDGVCITGGEPTLCLDLHKLCQKIKKAGFKIKLDTNGTNPEMLSYLLSKELVDFIAMDFKAPIAEYEKVIGKQLSQEEIYSILKSRDIVFEAPEYEFRTTVIPGIHDKIDIAIITGLHIIGAKNYAIQNFWNTGNHLDPKFNKVKPFTKEKLQEFKQVAEKNIKNVEVRSLV